MDIPHWESDQVIFDLIAQVNAEASTLMENPAAGTDLDHRLYGVASLVLSISPTVVNELYDTFAKIANAEARAVMDEALRAIDSSLHDWNGAAAEAFKQHMGHVRAFANLQVGGADKLLYLLRSSFLLAIHARDDLKRMMETWLDTSRKFREDEEAKWAQTAIKIGRYHRWWRPRGPDRWRVDRRHGPHRVGNGGHSRCRVRHREDGWR